MLKSIELSALESGFYLSDLPPISTFTWLQGNFEKTKIILQERLQMIVAKNPWVQGRIKRQWNGKLFLRYKTLETEEGIVVSDVDVDENLHVVASSESFISRDTDIEQLSSLLIEAGLTICNSYTDPVFKVFIIPCRENPNTTFGLFVQMSHIIGDGATYYQLMHMLCSEQRESIVSLNPERKTETYEKETINLLGKNEAGYTISAAYIARYFRGLMIMMTSKHKLEFKYDFVDNAKIKVAKADAVKDENVPFVSTNDVLTSWFMNDVQSQTALMVINLRSRLDILSENDVGNYENFIFYRKEDYASPSLIRKSLIQCRRVVTQDQKLPTLYESSSEKEAVVTNWYTLAKAIEIEGCKEELHLPIVTSKSWSSTIPLMIIFRAKEGKVGLCYFKTGEVNHLDHCPFTE